MLSNGSSNISLSNCFATHLNYCIFYIQQVESPLVVAFKRYIKLLLSRASFLAVGEKK